MTHTETHWDTETLTWWLFCQSWRDLSPWCVSVSEWSRRCWRRFRGCSSPIGSWWGWSRLGECEPLCMLGGQLTVMLNNYLSQMSQESIQRLKWQMIHVLSPWQQELWWGCHMLTSLHSSVWMILQSKVVTDSKTYWHHRSSSCLQPSESQKISAGLRH